jgi:hypothetical protein
MISDPGGWERTYADEARRIRRIRFEREGGAEEKTWERSVQAQGLWQSRTIGGNSLQDVTHNAGRSAVEVVRQSKKEGRNERGQLTHHRLSLPSFPRSRPYLAAGWLRRRRRGELPWRWLVRR